MTNSFKSVENSFLNLSIIFFCSAKCKPLERSMVLQRLFYTNIWMKSPFRQKFSQKRSSFCALFKVMCFKLFQAFASKMIKEMLRFQTVKDINDAMQMKLFQTWKYPLLSLCHFVDEGCLYSNKLSTFGPCETHYFFTRDWHCGP